MASHTIKIVFQGGRMLSLRLHNTTQSLTTHAPMNIRTQIYPYEYL